jgi:hypothetical protein
MASSVRSLLAFSKSFENGSCRTTPASKSAHWRGLASSGGNGRPLNPPSDAESRQLTPSKGYRHVLGSCPKGDKMPVLAAARDRSRRPPCSVNYVTSRQLSWCYTYVGSTESRRFAALGRRSGLMASKKLRFQSRPNHGCMI